MMMIDYANIQNNLLLKFFLIFKTFFLAMYSKAKETAWFRVMQKQWIEHAWYQPLGNDVITKKIFIKSHYIIFLCDCWYR